jgi:hypothetical protein
VSVRFYMDVHVPRAVVIALRLRGVDVLTAQEDGADETDDIDLLLRASFLCRILVTQDADLLREGVALRRTGVEFAGVIYGHQLLVGVGQMIEDLALVAGASQPEEWTGRITYLPL